MKKIIACCGLNCATCDARIATLVDSFDLRVKTAEKWKQLYQVREIPPEMINCTGCGQAGPKVAHCMSCEIRSCVMSKGYKTCNECEKLNICLMLFNLHQLAPEASRNLKMLS